MTSIINQTQFMATLHMVYKLEANATGMNMSKNQQNFFFWI